MEERPARQSVTPSPEQSHLCPFYLSPLLLCMHHYSGRDSREESHFYDFVFN